MKKQKTAIFLVLLFLIFSLVGCAGEKDIKEKSPIDTRYTPQSQEIVTDYEYKYNFLLGEFVLVPNTHTETIPEKYEVCYLVVYIDDSTIESWETVDKAEYDRAVQTISAKGGGQ